MQWLWLNARTAIRLGLQDTWQVQGTRVMTGLQVNAIALIVASVATHRPAALWTIFAYPILLVLTYGFYVVRRLRGWNRLWKREPPLISHTAGQLNVALMTTEPQLLLLGVGYDVSCRIRDPQGREFEGDPTGFHRGRLYCSYPGQFRGAPALTPGIYTVIWRERKPPESGKWRVIDASRVKVPAQQPAGGALPIGKSGASGGP